MEGVAAAIVVLAAATGGVFVAEGVTGPGIAGAVWTGGFACGNWTGGFGAKNFAHNRITPMDNNDAARIRSSGVNLSFCPGKLKNAPHFGPRPCGR